MKFIFTAIFLSFAWVTYAQTYSLNGDVFANDGSPMIYATVVLLNPVDSTMQSFGITNKEGRFEIKNVKKGDYVLQTAFLGFETYYKNISIPVEANKLATVVMKPKAVAVEEVKVAGEYVPLAIKKDTVEYNANAFRLKPDAVTEDLLKKLPGIEVDRAGNIKAMGEDVKKLYVDGKEFFGNDPKVATKNVPADAVDKVQVYNRKSDESMFTGIDDGSREKTINLKLKEDKKNALFGDLMGGAGTGNRWQGSAKAYRFTDKIQVAALGMGNNVNQFGFSFNDYMNFSGGIAQMMHGSGSAQIKITSDDNFPINFGEPVSGLNTSGAGGFNFSYSKSTNDRVFISYLGNGTKKELEQTTATTNFVEGESFEQNQELNETDKNNAHRFNFGLRNRLDTTQNIILDGNIALLNNNNSSLTFDNSSYNNILVNQQKNETSLISDRVTGSANATYAKKIGKGKSVFEVGGNLSLSQGLAKNDIYAETIVLNLAKASVSKQYQDNQTNNLNYSADISFSRFLGKGKYIIPSINVGNSVENLDRTQGNPEPETVIDSLSPEFQNKYGWIRPKLSFKYASGKTSFTVAFASETGKLRNTLNGVRDDENNFTYILPSFWYEYQFQTGRRLMMFYNSNVTTPNAIQLLPVINNLNPLSLYYGNPDLKPEISHQFNTHYILFDQFSFTSLMAMINGSYTKDKINWDRTVDNNLVMTNTLKNFDRDFSLKGNIDFSTPIRSWGMKININLQETWNKGENLINQENNFYTNFGHRASFSIDNRKKEKWDVNTGIQVSLTNSKYTMDKSMNNRYLDMKWFGDAIYTPNDTWNFELNTDFTRYTDNSFNDTQKIPLLSAGVSYFFLKNKRGTLKLYGWDLLNQNKIVQRFGELNYLREIRSNSIGRFVMLSFTYRLNKFGKESGGIDIKMKR